MERTRKRSPAEQVSSLKSNAQIRRMYLDCCNRGWWKGTDRDGEVEFIALAELAIRQGEQPVTYFYQMVRNGCHYPIPEKDYDIGWKRWKEIHHD